MLTACYYEPNLQLCQWSKVKVFKYVGVDETAWYDIPLRHIDGKGVICGDVISAAPNNVLHEGK